MEPEGKTPRPTSVTYGVKELFSEIRDELRQLNLAVVGKADKSDLDRLEAKVEVLERVVAPLADIPSRVRVIENGKAPAEAVATLAQEMQAVKMFIAKGVG